MHSPTASSPMGLLHKSREVASDPSLRQCCPLTLLSPAHTRLPFLSSQKEFCHTDQCQEGPCHETQQDSRSHTLPRLSPLCLFWSSFSACSSLEWEHPGKAHCFRPDLGYPDFSTIVAGAFYTRLASGRIICMEWMKHENLLFFLGLQVQRKAKREKQSH